MQNTGIIEQKDLEVMEKLDEEQIIQDLKGKVIRQYFYEFPSSRGQVVGISWAGIKVISSMMASQGHPISVVEIIKDDSPDSYRVMAKARDLSTQEDRWGASEQPKMMRPKDGSEYPDNFALAKAVAKAQRNAIKQFIPEMSIQQMYKEWSDKKATTKNF